MRACRLRRGREIRCHAACLSVSSHGKNDVVCAAIHPMTGTVMALPIKSVLRPAAFRDREKPSKKSSGQFCRRWHSIRQERVTVTLPRSLLPSLRQLSRSRSPAVVRAFQALSIHPPGRKFPPPKLRQIVRARLWATQFKRLRHDHGAISRSLPAVIFPVQNIG